jgi:hypothetical protein
MGKTLGLGNGPVIVATSSFKRTIHPSYFAFIQIEADLCCGKRSTVRGLHCTSPDRLFFVLYLITVSSLLEPVGIVFGILPKLWVVGFVDLTVDPINR